MVLSLPINTPIMMKVLLVAILSKLSNKLLFAQFLILDAPENENRACKACSALGKPRFVRLNLFTEEKTYVC